MIATSAALAFGPAIDAARSRERRVRTKLTTSTVRHTRAASHNLRTINKTIADNYDSKPVTASSDLALRNGDIEICLCFLHMPATCSPICPSLRQRPPRSMCTRQRIDHSRKPQFAAFEPIYEYTVQSKNAARNWAAF